MPLQQWIAARRHDRQAELDAMRQRAADAPSVSPDDALTFYLVARTIDKRTIEGRELDILRRANHAVDMTRKLLDKGRGNVSDDIEETANESTWRMMTARELMSDLDKRYQPHSDVHFAEISAASATQLRAGNCDEYANVTTLSRALRLEPSEMVHRVAAANVDHVWSELRVHGQSASADDAIMDAWTEGPAVLREDSRFASNPNAITSLLHLNADTASRAAQRVRTLAKKLQADDKIKHFMETMLAECRADDVRLSKEDVWPATMIISDEFGERVGKGTDALAAKMGHYVLPQIIAAGVSRQLGSSVAQAVEMAKAMFPPEE